MPDDAASSPPAPDAPPGPAPNTAPALEAPPPLRVGVVMPLLRPEPAHLADALRSIAGQLLPQTAPPATQPGAAPATPSQAAAAAVLHIHLHIRDATPDAAHAPHAPAIRALQEHAARTGPGNSSRHLRITWICESDNGQTDALNHGLDHLAGYPTAPLESTPPATATAEPASKAAPPPIDATGSPTAPGAAAPVDLLCWLNADDALLPGALQTVARALAAATPLPDAPPTASNANANGANASNANGGGGAAASQPARHRWPGAPRFLYGDAFDSDTNGAVMHPNPFTEAPDARRYLYSHNNICQPTLFFTPAAWQATRPLDTACRWFMDYEWLGRAALAGIPFQRLPAFLAANRDHPGTLTNTGGLPRLRELLRIQRARPGPPLLLRPAPWLHALDHLIKAAAARRAPATLQRLLHRLFLRIAAPREADAIRQRFDREVSSQGGSIAEIWQNYEKNA